MLKGLLRYILTALVVMRGYLLAPFSSRHRGLIHLISRNSKVSEVLGDIQPEWAPAIPIIRVSDLVSLTSVRLPLENFTDGNVSALELMVLAALAQQPFIRNIFEIGTFNGLTALTMAMNAAPDTRLYTLDLPPQSSSATQLKLADADVKYVHAAGKGGLIRRGTMPEEKKVQQLFGDSAAFDYTPYKRRMNLIFVDGSHSYEYVRSDTAVAMELLEPGKGFIAWHDYNTFWPGVIRFLEEFHRAPEGRDLRRVEGTSLVVLKK